MPPDAILTDEQKDQIKQVARALQDQFRDAETAEEYRAVWDAARQRLQDLPFFINIFQSYQWIAEFSERKLLELETESPQESPAP